MKSFKTRVFHSAVLVVFLVVVFRFAKNIEDVTVTVEPYKKVIDYAFNVTYPWRVSEDEILVDSKFQMKSDFAWRFSPLFHRTEQGNWGMGYFIPSEDYHSSKGNVLSQVDKISITKFEPSGETLLEYAYARFEEVPEEQPALLLIDGNARIDKVIRLDLGKYDHWLYLQKGDTIYQLYGNVENAVWQCFLDAFSVKSQVQIDGCRVWDDVCQLSAENYRLDNKYSCFCYDNGVFRFYDDSKVLFYECDEEGFRLEIVDKDYDDETKEIFSTISLQTTESLSEYETEEEMLAYFQKKYPKMNYYGVCAKEGYSIYEEVTNAIYEDVFRKIMVGDSEIGYFKKDGVTYKVVSEGRSRINLVCNNAGYDYDTIFYWQRYDDGSKISGNLVSRKYFLEKDVGVGMPFSFHIKREEKNAEDEGELGDSDYCIEICKNGENTPFQVIHETSAESWPFSFEDFNADGYQDLMVEFFYGANGGSASHYLWSPSTGQFVKASDELEYYGTYSVDPETRRLYMHYHGSAVSGTEETFQWSNEMDCELIKKFIHDSVWPREGEDQVEVFIAEYAKGKENVLTDYCYTYEEYNAMGHLIWGSYYADFVWEKDVQHPVTGENYVLRYSQDFMYDNGEKISNSWIDELYIYREDTYILGCLENETNAPYTQIFWEDRNHDGEKELIIQYEDDTQVTYTWEQLLEEKEGEQS